jgi:hypothetical protein
VDYQQRRGLPLNGKRLINSLASGEARAVVNPASNVGSYLSHAEIESASPKRQSLATAGGQSHFAIHLNQHWLVRLIRTMDCKDALGEINSRGDNGRAFSF